MSAFLGPPFATWRRLWLWLAEAESELGLPISEAAITALREHLVPTDGELEAADRYERDTKHDVMAQIHALGDVAPEARPFLHLGATSAFVGDNADLRPEGRPRAPVPQGGRPAALAGFALVLRPPASATHSRPPSRSLWPRACSGCDPS
jgi:hypothetical protein